MTEEKKGMNNLENIDSLKEKLATVSSEIDAIKHSFSKSAEDLSRIQNMLSINRLDDISGVLEKYENRVAEAERRRMEAAEGAKRYSEELEKEKERLIKLWDAYKNQEEELSDKEKKVATYEDQMRQTEASKKQLEDDYTARINTLAQKLSQYESKAGQYENYEQRYQELEKTRNHLENEVHELRQVNNKQEDTIHELNRQLSDLKGRENYSEYKEKYEEVVAEYEKEKERLTKLYQLYEETDSECKRLKSENINWQDWYNSNREIFNKLFAQNPPIGEMEEYTEGPEPPENPIDRPIKQKKKLRFRK